MAQWWHSMLVIAGKNNIAVEVLSHCVVKKYSDIAFIPNSTDTEKDSWQRSALKYAKENNIKIATLESVYHIEDLVFLSLEYDRLINPNLFKSKKLYNIHFSLLPKYKGMYTSVWPILYGEKYSGTTLHLIANGIDTGDIIDSDKFEIDIMDSSRDLYYKYLQSGKNLAIKNLDNLILNKVIVPISQNKFNSTYFSKSSIDFSSVEIDINATAIQIYNFVRAYNFREYQLPKFNGINIISASILGPNNTKKCNVIYETNLGFVVSAIDRNIMLYKDRFEELMTSVEQNDIDMVYKIAMIPKIIDTQNKNGHTALMVALYNNYKDIAKLLLSLGADVSMRNYNGTTMLMYAKEAINKHGDSEMFEILLRYGSDILQRDNKGKNILDYIQEENIQKEINMILKNIN